MLLWKSKDKNPPNDITVYPEEGGSVCFQNFANYIPVYCKLLGSRGDRRGFIYSNTRGKQDRAFG